MLGKVKGKLAAWFVGRSLKKLLVKADVKGQQQRRTIQVVKKAVSNMVSGKKSIKAEPVVYGGVITVAVALAGAFGLELSNEQLAVTVSTVIAIVSFLQRRLVTPTNKEQ